MNRLVASSSYLFIGDTRFLGNGGGGGVDASAYYAYLSFRFALVAAPREGELLALSCQAFARLLLAELELVLWSRRVVAL